MSKKINKLQPRVELYINNSDTFLQKIGFYYKNTIYFILSTKTENISDRIGYSPGFI